MVEALYRCAGDAPQRSCEFRSTNEGAHLEIPFDDVHSFEHFFEVRVAFAEHRDARDHEVVCGKTFLGDDQRGLDELVPGKPPEALVKRDHAGKLPWGGDCQPAYARGHALVFTVGVVVFTRDRRWGCFPKVEGDGGVGGSVVYKREAAPPESGGEGVHHTEDERGGDGGVDSVASTFEHGGADLRGERVVGCNSASGKNGGRSTDGLREQPEAEERT